MPFLFICGERLLTFDAHFERIPGLTLTLLPTTRVNGDGSSLPRVLCFTLKAWMHPPQSQGPEPWDWGTKATIQRAFTDASVGVQPLCARKWTLDRRPGRAGNPPDPTG